MLWIFSLIAVLFFSFAIRRIHPKELGIVLRLGRPRRKIYNPGFVFVLPFLDRLRRIPNEPFSVSLPPQSAITRDEIPIQLQASLDAHLRDATEAVTVIDWRISTVSYIQELMKDRLEDLDFDKLDEKFPEWIESIRNQLHEKTSRIGVEITGLQISNLSPRTKPQP